MTRKRFVKLLMSQGYSRNGANEIAIASRAIKDSYEEAYRHYTNLNSLSAHVQPLTEALNSLTKAVTKIVSSFGVAASAFSSAFSVAMQEPDPFGGVCHRCGGTGLEKRMQSMATFDGPSVRGPDLFGICPRCFGTGREPI